MSGKEQIDVASLSVAPGSDAPDLADIAIKKQTISVSVGATTVKIFSQQTDPPGTPKLTVLLLHGQSFTSNHWVEIHTLHLLASWGYKAVAIDLPGYGKSSNESLGHTSREDFLAALVKMLGVSPVIVSPSMSGSFALPFLFSHPELSLERAAAYIPVAPVMTGQFKHTYSQSQLRTLIVYGANDAQLGLTSLNDLQLLPKSRIACIPNAGHACYMNQPALWHNVLYAFLSTL